MLFNEQIKTAFDISESIINTIKKNNLLHEYVSDAYSDRCEIFIAEYRNRSLSLPSQLSLSDRALFREFRKTLGSAFIRGVMYPAHFGAACRAFAWYNAFKKRKRIARYFFQKAISRHHTLGMRYEEAKSLRELAFFYEGNQQPGLARDFFNQAYTLFEKCGANIECTRLEEKVDKEIVKKRGPEKLEKETTAGRSTSAADQVRVDMLYEVSLSLSHNEDLETLLYRIATSMIRTTGAQFGYVMLEGDDVHEQREFAIDFNEQMLSKESVYYSADIMRMAMEQMQIVTSGIFVQPDAGEEKREGSALCAPLIRGDKYYGYVYLSNTLVGGLFSENARKAAQIISAQAGFVIENAYLMEEYKRLTMRLEDKVKEQTKDIGDKHEQLMQSNIKLVESERMKELLSGTIVHDIKNFAAGISGNVKLLSYKYKDDVRTIRTVDLVIESCADILNLASNLLDINKMEEGKLVLEQRDLFFEELAAAVRKYSHHALFEEKKITVTITPPNDDFKVFADTYLLERIFQNLFSNAAKYTETSGTIEVTFMKGADENVISFFNSGSPIPIDHRQSIFEKYARVENKAMQQSKGLGLFFCKTVMDAHKGRIWLETDAKGNYFKLGFRNREK